MTNPEKMHLPVQNEHLPQTYHSLASFYLGSAILLAFSVSSKQGRNYFLLQATLVVLLLLKAGVLRGHAWHTDQLGQHGTVSPAWIYDALQIIDKVQEILSLVFFMLLSLGFRILHARLNIAEVRTAAGVAGISFYLGVHEVTCKPSSVACGG